MLALLPWDFPVLDTINVLVPAILTGNSVLLKDNPETPVFSEMFENCISQKAPGLAQKFFISTLEAQSLYKGRKINYVVFSGTYDSAIDIYYELGQNDFIDCNLDLGGLDTAYIDPSCDLEDAVEQCMWGVFYNSGQSRSSIESILVHQDLKNKFTNMLSEKVQSTFKLENPMNENSNYGPITWP